MKKVIMFFILAVITVGVMSCKESKPAKTAAELKADSIAQAKKDSVKSIADFKKESIATMNKVIKRKISSDPEFGEVLETKDKILNDSIYFAVSRIVWKNKYGAKEQHDEFLFAFCRRDKKDVRMIYWTNSDYCNKGMKSMIGDNFYASAHIGAFFFPKEKYGTFVEALHQGLAFRVDRWFN